MLSFKKNAHKCCARTKCAKKNISIHISVRNRLHLPGKREDLLGLLSTRPESVSQKACDSKNAAGLSVVILYLLSIVVPNGLKLHPAISSIYMDHEDI